jgi:hypothetical protein
MTTQLKNLAVAAMLLLLLPAISIAQQFDDPVDYNNFIVGHQTDVVTISMEYISISVHSEDERAVESKRQQVVKQLKKSINEVKRAEGYKGDNRLKSEAIDVFELYLSTYTTDFNEAELLKKDRQSSFDAMESYFKAQEKAEKKLAAASDQFSRAQDAYAKKYDLLMEEGEGNDELGNKMQIVSDVNVYTRKLFLLYFKPFKIDAAFLDAFNEQKVSTMKSKRAELLKHADDGLTKLRLLGPFKGDKSYMNATKELLSTYKELCQGDYKELVTIIERKDKLTQEDVDRANAIIQAYNENIQKLMKDFNESNSTFMQKHIPK